MDDQNQLGDGLQRVTKVRCVQAPQHRTIVVDGAWGSVKQDGIVHMTVYNDGPPPPVDMELVVQPDGHVSETASEPTMLRTFEATLVFNAKTAMGLALWLASQVERWHEVVHEGEAAPDADAEGSE